MPNPASTDKEKTNFDVVRNITKGDPSKGRTKKRNALRTVEREFFQELYGDIDRAINPKPLQLRQDNTGVSYQRDIYICTVSTSLFYNRDADPEAPSAKTPLHHDVAHFKSYSRSDSSVLLTVGERFRLDDFRKFHVELIHKATEHIFSIADEDFKKNKRYHSYKPGFIVVTPEFSFPFPMGPKAQHDHLLELNRLTTSKNKDYWQSTYLLSGTFHDHESERNLAVMDWPFLPEDEGAREIADQYRPRGLTELTQDERKIERYQVFHPKRMAAEGLGEKLRPLDGIDWHYYDSPIGTIGILICFDAYDARMLLGLMRWKRDRAGNKRLSFLIVPTYSHNDEIRSKCQLISKWLNCGVIYVNAQYPDPAIYEGSVVKPYDDAHGFFVSGKDLSKHAGELSKFVEVYERHNDVVIEGESLWFNAALWRVDFDAMTQHLVKLDAEHDLFNGVLF